jgi:hypothetical protein
VQVRLDEPAVAADGELLEKDRQQAARLGRTVGDPGDKVCHAQELVQLASGGNYDLIVAARTEGEARGSEQLRYVELNAPCTVFIASPRATPRVLISA